MDRCGDVRYCTVASGSLNRTIVIFAISQRLDWIVPLTEFDMYCTLRAFDVHQPGHSMCFFFLCEIGSSRGSDIEQRQELSYKPTSKADRFKHNTKKTKHTTISPPSKTSHYIHLTLKHAALPRKNKTKSPKKAICMMKHVHTSLPYTAPQARESFTSRNAKFIVPDQHSLENTMLRQSHHQVPVLQTFSRSRHPRFIVPASRLQGPGCGGAVP